MAENLYCSSQIGNSKDFEKNYEEINWHSSEEEENKDFMKHAKDVLEEYSEAWRTLSEK